MLYWSSYAANILGYIYFYNNQLEFAEAYLVKSEIMFNEMLQRNSWYSHDSLNHVISFGVEPYFPQPPLYKRRMMWQEGKDLYYLLYKINEANKKDGAALKYHVAYTRAKDTVDFYTQKSELMGLQTRYESQQKEEQISFLVRENEFNTYRLNQSRILIIGLIGLVVLIIILAVIIVFMSRLRERQNNMILQQKLFRSQMNPHFLFNSLVSIQNFIVNQEPSKASKYLSKFSKLVRNILDSSFEEYISLEEEISTIEYYLELQKVRYSDKFEYSIDLDETIDEESIMIPPMLAQPIIENAIEHGIKHKESNGHIIIRFLRINEHILFEIEDDGVGRTKAMEIVLKQDKDHKSLATAITRERIAVLNKKSKKKITLNILDLKDERGKATGTRVTFEIPVLFG
jgi:hypothetical protein